MTGKRHDISGLILTLAIVSVYFFGFYAWKHPNIDAVITGRRLYYISGASVLYMVGWLVLFIARSLIAKISGAILVGVFSVGLFEEIAYGDKAWTDVTNSVIAFFTANVLLVVLIIEKSRNRWK